MPNQTKTSQSREDQNPVGNHSPLDGQAANECPCHKEGQTKETIRRLHDIISEGFYSHLDESILRSILPPLDPNASNNVTLNFFGHKLELEDEDTSPLAIHTVAAGFDYITGKRLELNGTESEFAELRDTLNRTFPLPVIEPRKTRVLEQTTIHKDGPPTRDLLFQMESEILNDDGSRDWVTLHTVVRGEVGWVAAAESNAQLCEMKKQLDLLAKSNAKLVGNNNELRDWKQSALLRLSKWDDVIIEAAGDSAFTLGDDVAIKTVELLRSRRAVQDALAVEVSRSAELQSLLDNTKKALDSALATIIKVTAERDAANARNRKLDSIINRVDANNTELQQRVTEYLVEINRLKGNHGWDVAAEKHDMVLALSHKVDALLATNDKLTNKIIEADVQNAALLAANNKLTDEAIGLRESQARPSGGLNAANARLLKVHDIVV